MAIHVQCLNPDCLTFDIAGPGHPAVECAHPEDTDCAHPEAQHVLTDRTKLRHSHADGCEPHPETGHYPLHFTFMAATGEHGPAVTVTGA